jgi:hypothetical protein
VVKTRFHAPTYKKQVVEVIEAIALGETLGNLEPRPGKYGPFWTLGDADAQEFIM